MNSKKKLTVSIANLDVLKNVKDQDLNKVIGGLPTPHDTASEA